MKRLVTLGMLMALLLGGGLVSAAPPAKEVAVQIKDFAYSPASVTIAAGDSVTWTNMDTAPHTVSDTGLAFDSGQLAQNGTFTQVFDRAGTWEYVCSLHPNMKGTVIVQAAAADPTQPTAAPAQPTAAPSAETPPAAMPASGAGDSLPLLPLAALALLLIAGALALRRRTA